MKAITTTRFDETHLTMTTNVVKYCLSPERIAVTQSIPAFYNAIANVLQPNLNLYLTLNGQALMSIKGYAQHKLAIKEALADMSTNIMNCVYTYALTIDDKILAAKMKVSRSALMGEKYMNFAAVVDAYIDIVAPLVSELGDYSVTQANVDAWRSLLAELNANMALPKNMIARRVAIKAQAQALLRQSVTVLYDHCDRLSYQFRSSNKMFYAGYKSCRKLAATHVSTQLRAHITMHGAPVAYADVYIIGTDRNGVTDADGYCLVNELPFGMFEVAVSTKDGTQTFGKFRFKKGQSRTEHINLTTSSMIKGTSTMLSPHSA